MLSQCEELLCRRRGQASDQTLSMLPFLVHLSVQRCLLSHLRGKEEILLAEYDYLTRKSQFFKPCPLTSASILFQGSARRQALSADEFQGARRRLHRLGNAPPQQTADDDELG